MIHGHGDDLYKSGKVVVANFSTNVWYEADPTPLHNLLIQHADRIGHYPEPDAGAFLKVAADYHQLLPENIIAGNGATELFYLVAHAFAGKQTLLPAPSFTEYEDACALYEHKLTFITDADIRNLPADRELMFICNPNNPDGKIWSDEEIRILLEHYPQMTLVVDESFIHFAPEVHSACCLLPEHKNLLVIRSMTKSYAIPGLRLGYMMGNSSLIERIRHYKQPWTVNALAIEVGNYLLKCGDVTLPDAGKLLERQKVFSAQIARISGFYPYPSKTSFFLIRTDYDSGHLKHYLLEKHAVLIRDASNFRGLNNHYFRINTLTEEKNSLLLEALKEFVTTIK